MSSSSSVSISEEDVPVKRGGGKKPAPGKKGAPTKQRATAKNTPIVKGSYTKKPTREITFDLKDKKPESLKLVPDDILRPKLKELVKTFDEKKVKKEMKEASLVPIQYAMSRLVTDKIKKGTVTIRSKMGTGKTRIMTDIALTLNNTLIVVPSASALGSTFTPELENLGAYNLKPEDSDVIMYGGGANEKHREYFEALFGGSVTRGKNKHLVVIVSATGKLSGADKFGSAMTPVDKAVALFAKRGIGTTDKKPLNIIVDEAHKKRDAVQDVLGDIRVAKGLVVLMSGSMIPKSLYSVDYKIINPFGAGGPKQEWKFIDMPSATPGTDRKAWTDEISEIVKKEGRLLVWGDGDSFRQVSSAFKDRLFVKFGSKGAEGRFMERPDSYTLITGKGNVEGLNIFADAIICINPGASKEGRIAQLAGRIVRPGNPAKKVTMYMLCGGDEDFLRSLYTKVYFNSNWSFQDPDDNVTISEMAKSYSMLKAYGMDEDEFLPVDAQIIFGDFYNIKKDYIPSDVVEWWLTETKNDPEETKLSVDVIVKDMFIRTTVKERNEAYTLYKEWMIGEDRGDEVENVVLEGDEDESVDSSAETEADEVEDDESGTEESSSGVTVSDDE